MRSWQADSAVVCLWCAKKIIGSVLVAALVLAEVLAEHDLPTLRNCSWCDGGHCNGQQHKSPAAEKPLHWHHIDYAAVHL